MSVERDFQVVLGVENKVLMIKFGSFCFGKLLVS